VEVVAVAVEVVVDLVDSVRMVADPYPFVATDNHPKNAKTGARPLFQRHHQQLVKMVKMVKMADPLLLLHPEEGEVNEAENEVVNVEKVENVAKAEKAEKVENVDPFVQMATDQNVWTKDILE